MKPGNYPRYFFLIALIAVGCSNNGSDPSTEDNDKDRKEILTHWTDNIILPAYTSFKVSLDAMQTKGNAFIASPNTTSLSEFRTAWAGAYLVWQRVELFEFGPADRQTMRSFFNIYPADVAGIQANINDSNANLEVPAAYPRQGFPALDYLLNGTGANDQEIVAFFTDAIEGQKRLSYISRLLNRMTTILSSVQTEWNNGYRETFISKTGLDIGSSMGNVVNAYVLNFERYVRSGKIGIPAGAIVAGGGTIQPEKVEAYYKRDLSLSLARTAVQASNDFFNGKNFTTGEFGPSFKSYLDALEAKDISSGKLLSTLTNESFQTIEVEMSSLGANLSLESQNNTQQMLDVFSAMQATVRILKVDMTSAMSITITYTDNDGD